MAWISGIDLRGFLCKGDTMTPNRVTVVKGLRRASQMDAPDGVHGRWRLELVGFEPVLSFPFSHCYSFIVASQTFKRSFVKYHTA